MRTVDVEDFRARFDEYLPTGLGDGIILTRDGRDLATIQPIHLLDIKSEKLARFTDRARKALQFAEQIAQSRYHLLVTTEHLLLAISKIEPGPGRMALERLGLDLSGEINALKSMIERVGSGDKGGVPALAPELELLLNDAREEAKSLKHTYVGTEHLVLGILRCDRCPAAQFLLRNGITIENCRNAIQAVLGYK